ncbi:SusD/RagB family nutrient-binding outer membrane lipoprotein [Flexithrix dorotheae]|uniref:SusD/RagB family nutrient-binding outer membrane lipoprotein n=1 Tax=Flexithrix dorotheae TaxID=70993 RepID=UPI00035D8947|nr:SusD/RagB family nutrient-binding outer membrane lipoprotein [Flexithrix dorotheae]
MNFHSYKKITISLLSCFVLLLGSCTSEFEELNTNPNDPTVVPPETVFPGGIRQAFRRIHGHTTRLQRLGLDGGTLWVQHLARNQYTNEGDTYNPDASMRTNNWKGFYQETLVNIQTVVDITSDEEGNYKNTNFEAAAIIMREYVFSVITDTWGAVPYLEAIKGTEGILAPAYTSQEEIYTSILANLKTASDMLDESGATINGDILFNGDVLMWKKFANSLRLKLANRQSAKKPAESAAIFSEILGNPAAYPVFTSIDDQALFVHEARNNGNNNNAWHDIMVFQAREDWSLSKTLVEKMADADGNATDPRITVYANEAASGDFAGKYYGAPNGLPEALASAYINTASRPGSFFTQELTPFVVMGYSELLFVLAEATLDGDYSGGMSAKEYLDMAVTASFEHYGLEVPAGYLAGLSADKETIMTEKWKAMFGQGIEAWTEYRRTGFPVLSTPDPNSIFENEGKVPTRLQYPESEYSLNKSNVEAAEGLNGGPNDKLTKLWWAE